MFPLSPSLLLPAHFFPETPRKKKKNVFKKVCSTLPADSAELCASAVDENAAKLFAVVADFDCNTLCVVAGACPPPDPPSGGGGGGGGGGEVVEKRKGGRLEVSDDPVDLCGVCTSVLSQLHDAVTDPDKQREAMAAAARVCSALHRFRDECLGDVQQYGPLVINTVGQYVSADLCAAAGICSGPSSAAAAASVSSSSSSSLSTAEKREDLAKRTLVDVA